MVQGYKKSVKHILGELPFTAELYWQFRQQGKPLSKSSSLKSIEQWLPEWCSQAESARAQALPGKKIALFATLRYWIEYSALLSCSMAGLGHQMSMAYLPYTSWRTAITRFDLRRQNAYIASILEKAAPLIEVVSLLDIKSKTNSLPASLSQAIREVTARDVQYTLQLEDFAADGANSPSANLFRLRLERNNQAASAALTWLRASEPEVIVIPNGMILEMGVLYQVARFLGIPTVTYEFGEQRGRIWLAQNDEVMRQDTTDLWKEYKDHPLTASEWQQVQSLFASRQQASLWENFARLWQGQPGQGGEKTRQDLALDQRPIVLLAANVIGDSLTLGRQCFSQTMTEWLQRTACLFAELGDVQFVIRIHPGERYTKGPSVADVVRSVLPSLPENLRLVAADDPVNTYDLLQIADLGLVYTTTVGLEMAMSGMPVIVAGQTHYRGKGFTLDPGSWQEYFDTVKIALGDLPAFRLEKEKIELAWRYAYRFFFNYPLPFPWHLLGFGYRAGSVVGGTGLIT